MKRVAAITLSASKYLLASIILSFGIASAQEKSNFMPKISAMIRAKAEQNLSIQHTNFMVRNARFSVRGKVTDQVSYKLEVDWMDKEDISVNDAKIIYSPFKGFDLTIGQFKAPIGHDYIRNPADCSFANRNFINKRLSRNMRDVGMMFGYTLPTDMFTKFELGFFNGNSSNSFEHDLTKAVGGKFSLSPFDKSLLTLSGYKGQVTLNKQKNTHENMEMLMFTYYQYFGNFFVETEIGQRQYMDSISTKNLAAYGVLAYDFRLDNSPIIKITPAVRYDFFTRTPSGKFDSPRRFTAGLTFHLKDGNNAYFRLDYEKYTYQSGAKSESDMITLEYVIRL